MTVVTAMTIRSRQHLSANTATTITLLTPARLMATTDPIGLWAACLSARDPGTTDIGAVGAGVTAAIAACTAIAVDGADTAEATDTMVA